MFPETMCSFLPGCSDPVARVRRLTVTCPFVLFFPTENPSTVEIFLQVRCLPVPQVMRFGWHTNKRKEVWYGAYLISTRGEIKTEKWKKKFKNRGHAKRNLWYSGIGKSQFQVSIAKGFQMFPNQNISANLQIHCEPFSKAHSSLHSESID